MNKTTKFLTLAVAVTTFLVTTQGYAIITTGASKAKIVCIAKGAKETDQGLDTQVANANIVGSKVAGFSAGAGGKMRCYLLFYGPAESTITCLRRGELDSVPEHSNSYNSLYTHSPYCFINSPTKDIVDAIAQVGTETKTLPGKTEYVGSRGGQPRYVSSPPITMYGHMINAIAGTPGVVYGSALELIEDVRNSIAEDAAKPEPTTTTKAEDE